MSCCVSGGRARRALPGPIRSGLDQPDMDALVTKNFFEEQASAKRTMTAIRSFADAEVGT